MSQVSVLERPGTARRHARLALLAFVALAVVCRLPAILGTPLDFHTVRQLNGAILARGYEVRLNPPSDAHAADVAREAANDEGILEPPILDTLTGVAWAVAGERFWMPRLAAALGYLCGGIALFFVADTLIGRIGAWTTLGFYGFSSYGLLASTSFQPDPWLVGGMSVAVLMAIRWRERPNPRSRRTAIATTAAVVFMKPIVAPVVLGGVIGAGFGSGSIRSKLRDRDIWRLTVFAVLPGALYLGVGEMSGAIKGNSPSATFIPRLFSTASFWRGWLTQIGVVVTVPLFVLACVGLVFLARHGERAIGLGWLGGYVLFGAAVNYRISTHDYYSLPLVPIVALGLGVVVTAFVAKAPGYSRLVFGAVAAVLAIGLVQFWRDEVSTQRESRPIVSEYRSMGDLVAHRPVVVLAGDDGDAFAFYGRVRIVPWPSVADLDLDRLRKTRYVGARERLADLRSRSDADAFVVTTLAEIDAQPDLKSILDGLPVLYRSRDSVIYQLPPIA